MTKPAKDPFAETHALIEEGRRLRADWDAKKLLKEPEVAALKAEVAAKFAAEEEARKSKPPGKRFTAQEIEALSAPPSLPFVPNPPKIQAPLDVPRPETDVAAMERLTAAGLVRQPGTGDPPTPTPKRKRLTITEADGVERVIELDPAYGAWLSVGWSQPRKEAPWIADDQACRVGLFSVSKLELVDVEPDPAA